MALTQACLQLNRMVPLEVTSLILAFARPDVYNFDLDDVIQYYIRENALSIYFDIRRLYENRMTDVYTYIIAELIMARGNDVYDANEVAADLTRVMSRHR
jgi:hypothetical protein